MRETFEAEGIKEGEKVKEKERVRVSVRGTV